MRKLITLATVSLLLCVATSNYASNLSEPALVNNWLWDVVAESTAHIMPQTTPAAPAEPSSPDDVTTQLTSMAQKFEQFVNEYNQLQEQYKLRLDLLEDENAALKSKLRVLDKQVAHLQELQEANSGLSQQNWLVLGLAFGALATWLLALTLRGRRRPTSKAERVAPHINSPEADLEDEYDYLGSEEGIAAKLDLARAYVDMGDIQQARQTLEDVLKAGNEAQQQTARELIDQLAEDTVH